VDCTPLFPLSRNRLLASARAAGAAVCHHRHLLVLIAVIRLVAHDAPVFARDWAPFLYVSVAYYLTGHLFVAPSWTLERGCSSGIIDGSRSDDEILAMARVADRISRHHLYALFSAAAGGFAALVLTGHSSQANRYWTMVLAADLGAFAPLSVFQTRPPWPSRNRRSSRPAVFTRSRRTSSGMPRQE